MQTAMSTPFRFKQFSIVQDRCAMKVNTDGVLLGAWADVDGAKTILDIGTGTGVIALMMAQRNPAAIIDAIDIDADAFAQAGENFLDSLWSERLYAYHISLQNYFPDKKYDLIISNPPYFVDDYKTDNHQRNIAKHSVSLSYKELVSGLNRLLSDHGGAFLVLPAFNLQLFESLALAENLFITKLTEVIAVEGKSPYLVLIRLGREQKGYSQSSIVIQNEEGIFTNEYKGLTKEFYLKF
jgi:tRNA1Val (adenine37-N6)-methyltransferase